MNGGFFASFLVLAVQAAFQGSKCRITATARLNRSDGDAGIQAASIALRVPFACGAMFGTGRVPVAERAMSGVSSIVFIGRYRRQLRAAERDTPYADSTGVTECFSG